MNIAQERLINQHIAGEPLASPEEVVWYFGAIQAQEHASSLWAIGLRLRSDATEETVQQAARDRKIVRTWPMRGTIHYVPAEDTGWMTRLMARRVSHKFRTYLNNIDLTPAVLEHCREVLVRALEGGKHLTRKDLYAALEQAGVRTHQRGLHIMTYWAQAGVLCFGMHEGKQATFTLLDEWVPNQRELDDDAAVEEMTRRYFRSHGPATVHDFAGWSGLTIREIKQGLELAKADLESVELDGLVYWRGTGAVKAGRAEVREESQTFLLPCFDEYAVAYKDRSAVVAKESLKEAGYAVNNNNVIVDGRIAGFWRRDIKKNGVTVEVNPLDSMSLGPVEAIQDAADRYARFVGIEKPAIVTTKPKG